MAVSDSASTETPGVVDLRDDLRTPGEVLDTITRARSRENEVMVRTLNRGDAQAVFRLLNRPVQAVTQTGVRLHTTGTTVTLPDGSVPVIPSGVGDVTWELAYDGVLSGYVGDNRVAVGPVSSDLATLEYRTPWYHERERTHRIVTANGVLVKAGSNPDAVLTGYTRIPVPHIPEELHYLTQTTVQYRVDDETRVYASMASWVTQATTIPDIWRNAVTAFIEEYTMQAGGENLPVPRFTTVFRDWMAAHLPFVNPRLATAESAFYAVLDDRSDTQETTINGRDTMVLRDRATSIPLQALSQDFSKDAAETAFEADRA